MNEREKILLRLIAASDTLRIIQADLQRLPWDSQEAGVTLKRSDVSHILRRYLSEDLTLDYVEAWANAIEGRDDIQYEMGHEILLNEAIHQLANPLLTVPLTAASAKDMLAELQKR